MKAQALHLAFVQECHCLSQRGFAFLRLVVPIRSTWVAFTYQSLISIYGIFLLFFPPEKHRQCVYRLVCSCLWVLVCVWLTPPTHVALTVAFLDPPPAGYGHEWAHSLHLALYILSFHTLSLSWTTNPPPPLSFARTHLDPSPFGTHKLWSGPGCHSKALLCTHGYISLGTLTPLANSDTRGSLRLTLTPLNGVLKPRWESFGQKVCSDLVRNK